jgi:hypothetical protein
LSSLKLHSLHSVFPAARGDLLYIIFYLLTYLSTSPCPSSFILSTLPSLILQPSPLHSVCSDQDGLPLYLSAPFCLNRSQYSIHVSHGRYSCSHITPLSLSNYSHRQQNIPTKIQCLHNHNGDVSTSILRVLAGTMA